MVLEISDSLLGCHSGIVPRPGPSSHQPWELPGTSRLNSWLSPQHSSVSLMSSKHPEDFINLGMSGSENPHPAWMRNPALGQPIHSNSRCPRKPGISDGWTRYPQSLAGICCVPPHPACPQTSAEHHHHQSVAPRTTASSTIPPQGMPGRNGACSCKSLPCLAVKEELK